MKNKKNLKLFLNKEKVSELSKANKQRIVGGYPTQGGCVGGSGSGAGGATTCLYSCSCSIPGQGIC